MADNCRIIRTSDGEISEVKTPEGNTSKLFEKLNKLTGNNSESALELYAVSETEEFKEIQEIKSRKNTASNVVDPKVWDLSRGPQTLKGAPINTLRNNVTGADPELTYWAEEYARRNGIDYRRQTVYVEVDKSRAERIAKEYDKMKHNPQDPKVKEAYENLIRQTTAQYNILAEAGYEFYFFDETNDPYNGNPMAAMEELRNNKRMGVFSTEAGYGSDASDLDVSDNPMLGETGLTWDFNGKPRKVLANDLFRAVHDTFGHGLEGASFRSRGEENAWQAHSRLFTGSARGAITSETRGQNSWLNFNTKPYKDVVGEATAKEQHPDNWKTITLGEHNTNANVFDTVFADQKTGLMPEWTWQEGFNEGVAPQLKGGAAFSKFFANVTNTKNGGAKLESVQQVLNKSIEGYEKELEAYLKYGRNFQKHIMASIPGFVDARIRVLKGMADVAVLLGKGGKEVNMLDITSSEGYFTKAFAQLAQDKGVNAKADALDAGVTFQRDFNLAPQVPGVNYLLEAWGESFVDTDSGITIPLFQPSKKYGIIYEGMGFQFFTPTRDKEIAEVKSIMEPEGLFITKQKLKNADYARREVMKDEFKSQFFTQQEIADKAATVLKKTDEASVGMMDYQFDRLEYEKVLANNFNYVVQIYSSGNFAGYYASDSLEVINTALRATGDTTTKFNEEVTPSIIKGDANQLEINATPTVQQPTPIIATTGSEPSVKDVLDFINGNEDKQLTKYEQIELQNSMVGFKEKSSQVLYDKLFDALVNKNGVISFNKNKLQQSGLYNAYEISKIMSSPELQESIREALLKLKNTDLIEVDYNEAFSIPNSTKLSIFGKQMSSNPYVLENEIAQSVAGISEEQIPQVLDPVVTDKYNTDLEFKESVNNMARSLKVLPVMELVDGALVQKTTDIKQYLRDLIISTNNDALANEIAFLNIITPENWDQNADNIQTVLENLIELAKENGIDLRGLDTKATEMPREELLIFLASLEQVLEDTNEQTVNNFADLYNILYETVQPVSRLVATDNQFDQAVETTATEQEMLKAFSLVKKSDGVYRKVSDQSIQELYETFFLNKELFPASIETVEDLVEYVQREISTLDIPDYQIDPEIIEKMYLYKKYFKFNSAPRTVNTTNINKVVYEDAFVNDFVKEFNKFILKTDNAFFTIGSKGIEIISNDPITVSEAILSVPLKLREPLAQYNALSKNLNLDMPIEDNTFETVDYNTEKRNEAVNNPNQVPKLSGDYTYIREDLMAVRNENKNFIRTPQGIFEMVYESNNVKFYGRLPEANVNYKTASAEKPLSDVDFSQYAYLENSPEVFKTAKNYYSQFELKQIDEDYFACSI